ncbi:MULTISPECIES: SRPBCC family protein [Streptomyces]|uniref:SRPBCC family protein n=1 Tax=Streptomyces luteosporeus TaxID=173856 RepID=A0ABP6G3D2_9ACTN
MPPPRRLPSPHHYRFHGRWILPAPPDAVYAALEDADGYPAWWPQVREVRRLDDVTGVLRIRSVLPYDLVVTARETRRDPGDRTLEIVMCGDLDGWAAWNVVPHGAGGSAARFEEDVEVRKPLLRRLAVPCRPLFTANHAWMMRAGHRGLRALLAGPGRGI